MGLDVILVTWFNRTMKWENVTETMKDWAHSVRPKKKGRVTPQEMETDALRDSMRGQLKKLNEKGLSIPIVML